MSMKMGVPYSMVSTVVEFEDNRRIAWQTRGPTRLGSWAGGRIWRYEIEPVDGGSLVRESWDISEESAITKPLVRKGGGEDRARTWRRRSRVAIEEITAGLTAVQRLDGIRHDAGHDPRCRTSRRGRPSR